MSSFNRLRPCGKIIICAKFQDDCLKNATCTLRKRFTWTASQPASRPASQPAVQTDGRTDIVKSTQKVILSRTVYLKVGVRKFFLYVTISAQTHYTLSTYGGVGYKNGQ